MAKTEPRPRIGFLSVTLRLFVCALICGGNNEPACLKFFLPFYIRCVSFYFISLWERDRKRASVANMRIQFVSWKALRARKGKERCQQAGRMLSERGREAQALNLMQFSHVENSKMEYESRTVSTVPLQEHFNTSLPQTLSGIPFEAIHQNLCVGISVILVLRGCTLAIQSPLLINRSVLFKLQCWPATYS